MVEIRSVVLIACRECGKRGRVMSGVCELCTLKKQIEEHEKYIDELEQTLVSLTDSTADLGRRLMRATVKILRLQNWLQEQEQVADAAVAGEMYSEANVRRWAVKSVKDILCAEPSCGDTPDAGQSEHA